MNFRFRGAEREAKPHRDSRAVNGRAVLGLELGGDGKTYLRGLNRRPTSSGDGGSGEPMAVWNLNPQSRGGSGPSSASCAVDDGIRAMLRELGVTSAGVAVERLDDDQGLMALEAQAVQRAAGQRRIEFAAGRRAARSALAEIGVPGGAIPRGTGGSPLWPSGIAGSITHAHNLAAAVAVSTEGATSIGLDIELAQPLEESLWPEICNSDELASIRTLPASARGLEVLRVFGAKEAGYKCQYPLTGRFLEMSAASVHLSGDTGHFWVEFHDRESLLAGSRQMRGISRFVGGFMVSVACLTGAASTAAGS